MRRSRILLTPYHCPLTRARTTPGPDHALVIEHHNALFRHVADRIARALAPDAGILHPAIGELIGAPGRTAVDDDAAGAQVAHGANGELGRSRENAGLQPEPAFADGTEHRVDIVVGGEADHRPEYLLANHLHVRLDAGDHGRLELGAVTLAAGHNPGAAECRLVDPGFDAPCRRFVDQRADVGRGVEGIAELQLLHLVKDEVEELLIEA